MKEGQTVYFVDLSDGKLVEAELVEKTMLGDIEHTTVDISGLFTITFEHDIVAETKDQALEKYENWKKKFREDMLNDNGWLKSLLRAWRHENYNVAVGEKIIKGIIEDELKVKL